MKNNSEIKSQILSAITELSIEIRQVEDIARSYSIKIDDDKLYIALRVHRSVLNDLLKKL